MATKKNKNIKIDIPEKVATEETTVATTQNKVGYKGTVKISVVQNDRVLSTKIFHNAGGNELYKFLCMCISDPMSARDFAPKKIKLFYNTANLPTDPAVSLESRSSCIVANSSKATFDVLPGANKYSTKKEWYATLHFLIPNAYITGNDSELKINQIRLYPINTEVDRAENAGEIATFSYSADFKFTDENEKNWDPIIVQSVRNSYNLLIDWTLSFENYTDGTER